MEKNTQTEIQLAVGQYLPNVTLFRNNTGMGWAGKLIRKYNNGSVELADSRPLHAGLCVGSSDLIGWTSVIVTPEMVGRTIAIFTAGEVKVFKKGSQASEDQLKFLTLVHNSGGIAKIIRSPEEALVKLTYSI